MKKVDNFSNCLNVLKNADFELAYQNEIYRTGIIGQFNLTFELSWKALQSVLREHGVESFDTGSPREILQLGYKFGFINDAELWLVMLKKRNTSVHIYSEDEVDEMLLLIKDSFISAFISLENTLKSKLSGFEESIWLTDKSVSPWHIKKSRPSRSAFLYNHILSINPSIKNVTSLNLSEIYSAIDSAAKRSAIKIPIIKDTTSSVLPSMLPEHQQIIIAKTPSVVINDNKVPNKSATITNGNDIATAKKESNENTIFNMNKRIVVINFNGNNTTLILRSSFIVCHGDTLIQIYL